MADRRRRVVWTEQARVALDEILTYIAQDAPQAAKSVAETAIHVAEGLAELSERGRVVPELDTPTIREVFVHRYRLLYEVMDEQVVILAILHGARDFAGWREND